MGNKLHDTRAKILAQRAAQDERLRRIDAKIRMQQRNADTRRKILAGAAMLDRAERDATFKAELHSLLAAFLVRDHDRALFDLAPLPGGASGSSADARAVGVK
jgi:hypothetical protein